MAVTLDDHIRQIWQTAYNGCDMAMVESNPRAYALEWVKVG